MNYLICVLLGIAAGVLGGMFGIGGATILIPAMVLFFGLTQHQAQGTILAAMIPPIGLLAALRYYQAGNVKIGIAAFVALGFFFGGFIGANLIQNWPEPLLRKSFAVFLLAISVKMLLTK